MKTTRFRILITTLIMILLVVPSTALAWSTYPLVPPESEVADALDYLAGQQNADGSIGDFSQSAWVVMAIAAAGDDPNDWTNGGNSIVDYLSANAGDAANATDYSRMILAITAAGQDPANFGSIDFVTLLKSQYDGTQIGNSTALNDDAWGIMALISAGESPASAIITSSTSFIKSNQNPDGGWGWSTTAPSDADSTAAPIMALIAAGDSPASAPVQNALAYLKTQQVSNGGFDSWGSTNADTDSWVISALVAAGEDPTSAAWQSGSGNTPVDDLVSFQAANGSYEWQSGNPGSMPLKTTAGAIVALLGKKYPVAVASPQSGETINVRIEGETQTVWAGEVTVNDTTVIDDQGGSHYLSNPTALGALHEASLLGGFDYSVRDFGAMGLAITGIDGAGDWDSGPWWMFIVDGAQPSVGAGSFEINVTSPPSPWHEEVLFAFSSSFSEKATKLVVDQTQVVVGGAFTATVTYFDGSNWQPLAGATVHADTDYLTAADGTVSISIDHDTTIDVFAEMSGYIRSNRVAVTVGEGGSASRVGYQVGVTATIIPAISIEVSPDSVNLGDDLGPKDISNPVTLTIANTGAWDIQVTAEVQDTADDLFVDGLRIGGVMWNLFSRTISRGQSYLAQISLSVPETYAGTGLKSGAIIFWAEEAP